MEDSTSHSSVATALARSRHWPSALLVALVTAVAGALLAAPVSEWAMKANRISNFEGGRAFAMFFVWAPLAFVVGAVIGLAIGLARTRGGVAGYLKRQGIALAVIASLVLGAGGVSYLRADHPPLIDGKPLALDIELKVPAKGRSIEQLRAGDFSVGLLASASDRNYSDLRWADAVETGGFITVRAWSRLQSRSARREITAGPLGENRQIFDVVRDASPHRIDEEWSEWAPPRQRFDGTKPPEEEQYLVRYRVRFASEYSPTPTPTPDYEMAAPPAPEESRTPEPSSAE